MLYRNPKSHGPIFELLKLSLHNLTLTNLTFLKNHFIELLLRLNDEVLTSSFDENWSSKKTFFQIFCESGLSFHVAAFHLVEVGVARGGGGGWGVRGPEMPLDFRTNFTQTWLAICVVGSYSVSVGKNFGWTLAKATF